MENNWSNWSWSVKKGIPKPVWKRGITTIPTENWRERIGSTGDVETKKGGV